MPRPGDIVDVVRGEHAGQKAIFKIQENYFFHIEMVETGELLSVHKSQIASVRDSNERIRNA